MFSSLPLVGQELTVEGFKKSRFNPPVHIPPRVPLYDPGLPKSLNGKFNTTQVIRGTSPFQGQRQVIGDVPRDTIYTAHERPAGGLQGKLSRLMNRQSNQPVGTGALPQAAPPTGLQNRLQRSVATAVNSHQPHQPQRPQPQQLHQPQRRLAHNQFATAPQQPTPSKRVASRVNQQRQQTYQASHPSAVDYQYSQHKPARPVNIPAQVAAGHQHRRIQRTGVQEPVDAFANDLTQTYQQESEPVQTWNDTQNFTRSANTVASHRQSQRQEFLPSSQSAPDTEPISVMTEPNNDLTLEPESNSNRLDSSPSFENSGYSPMENTLRDPYDPPMSMRRTYQDEEDEGSGQDDDFENQVAEERAKIPVKSCEEFRAKLLTTPITAIPLDISPPARTDILGANPNRVWRDDNGNDLAQGTIADIRRGYVIINSSNGGQVRLPYARLSEADWKAIAEYWVLPEECGLGENVFMGRHWIPQTVNWHASALCHKPLYFENIQLERYGHSAGPILQPILSTGHFFERAFFVPYNTAINPPNECQYALGFYRPGDCAPWLKAPFPISLSGATRQALFWTGYGMITNY